MMQRYINPSRAERLKIIVRLMNGGLNRARLARLRARLYGARRASARMGNRFHGNGARSETRVINAAQSVQLLGVISSIVTGK